MLAGYRYLGDGHFYLIGGYTYIWSSIEYITSCVYLLNLDLSTSSASHVSDNVANGRSIQLNCETKTEVNFNKFKIDRTLISTKDASLTWTSVGSVQASGTSNSPKKYSYKEKVLQVGKYQYKLKMIDNDGTFKYSQVIEAEVAVPENYELSQNFPNPFNPNTVISYSLPSASKVKLIVYNTIGKTIKVLENGFKNAGTYFVNFNATDFPSGFYLYELKVGQFSQVKKMILIK